MTPSLPRSLAPTERLGAWMWLVRPLYFVVEIAVALASTAPYSLATGTISDLGALDCTSITRSGEAVPVCSPGHVWMNGAFVVFGLLMALGAVFLRGRFGGSRAMSAVLTGLLVVAGASSIATGLVPLDRYPDGHVLAATPVFVAQPLALVVLGALVLAHRRTAGLALIATGVVSAVAAVCFIAVPDAVGVTERLALWPTFVALAVAGRWQLTGRL